MKSYWKTTKPNTTIERIEGINYRRKSTCHPDRPHKAQGLCKACHDKLPHRQAQIKSYQSENARRDMLKHRYDISIEQYDQMLTAQKGLCAICHQPPRGKMKRLSVDHDHKTDNVRGLLCITCNRTVGYLDNPDWLAKAIVYLHIPPTQKPIQRTTPNPIEATDG